MMKKLGTFCLVVLIAIYVVKNPGATVEGGKYVIGQLSQFVDAL
jgi:hypothetical protein